MIPYGRQSISAADIEAVAEVLRSDWLTTGPMVDAFETRLAEYVSARHGVAVSSGTAALHCAMYALGVGPGDEVIVPPMTFAATANCVVYQGATPVFADVCPDTLLIDPVQVEKRITARTKAIIAVDYTGHPCDYDALREITDTHGLKLVADGCHALGAEYKGKRVGSIADLTVFSFHPVKHIATGEGGMIVTDDDDLARRMRQFRNHGITTDFRQREEVGSWRYEMVDLGFNYRLTDIQCSLGISQLKRLPDFLKRRREIAARYDAAFAGEPVVASLSSRQDCLHAYHLYVVRIDPDCGVSRRDALFAKMKAAGIGVNVHYIPAHFHPFYRKRFGFEQGACPIAEKAYQEIMSLPIYPGMRDEDMAEVIEKLLLAIDSL